MARTRSANRQLQLFIRQAASRDTRVAASNTLDSVRTPAATSGGYELHASAVLWLCIRFPGLVLEALRVPAESPAAVISGQGSTATLIAANYRAEKAGILPGVSLNAALALVPELIVFQRKISAEAAMLQNLAKWALSYTPIVSVDPDGALLLEIRGSLKLFGGLEQLRNRLKLDLSNRGYRAVMASAPVPRAALWLVRAGSQFDCSIARELPGVLADLPLECLRWPVKVRHKLEQMGVSTLGECFRLPREGFARRIGPEYLHELDQGLGRQHELLRYHEEPDVFHASFEFASETLAASEIENAARRLLTRLSIFLRERQAKVQQLSLYFEHYRQPSTLLEIALREPASQANYLLELLRLQLERQALPEPVIGIRVRAVAIPLRSFSNGHLFDAQSDGTDTFMCFIDRLRARLGNQHVHGIGQAADYRPERAWRIEALSAIHHISDVPGEMASRMRPLWLLERPERLGIREGRPVDNHNGVLSFLSDAERIETGWWDGNDVRRDYYTVAHRLGARWWIFQDCHDSCWYLHGIYG